MSSANASNGTLSPEADRFLAEATAEFNLKQEALRRDWRFGQHESWAYDPDNGELVFEFADERKLVAEGQLLGTFLPSNSTFEWAWNSPHFNNVVTRDSQRVKDEGSKLGLDYTQAGVLPIPGEAFLSYVCAIGLKVNASAGMFRAGEADDVQALIMMKDLRWV